MPSSRLYKNISGGNLSGKKQNYRSVARLPDNRPLHTVDSQSVLNISVSQVSVASKFEERLNRSQANIENRIKQDFERLQIQIQKRAAKEKSAE